jgi:hypothetical protein
VSQPATPAAAALPTGPAELPELAAVHWRPRVDECRLQRSGRLWLVCTLAHTVPFLLTGAGLIALSPLTLPVALVALAYAWIVPELYAQRGVNVVRPSPPSRRPATQPGAPVGPTGSDPERLALGLLGDLVGDRPRELLARTGLALERGRFGTWLVGPKGALLVRPGGRQVLCYCVRVNEPTLPVGDRIAHLLLALRADESGFATVANLTFAGARWRVRRRLPAALRPALDAACAV